MLDYAGEIFVIVVITFLAGFVIGCGVTDGHVDHAVSTAMCGGTPEPQTWSRSRHIFLFRHDGRYSCLRTECAPGEYVYSGACDNFKEKHK